MARIQTPDERPQPMCIVCKMPPEQIPEYIEAAPGATDEPPLDAKELRRYRGRGYADHEWDDETSASDPKGTWQGGSEYYARTYRCRVPAILLALANKSGDFDRVDAWIQAHDSVQEIWLP